MASVSSEQLAEQAGVNSATLRRDLSALGIGGTRGVGYDVKHVLHHVGLVLGVNQEWPVSVIGAGNLGRALVNYAGLSERGFPVRAVFDISPAKVGTEVSGLVVQHLDRLPEVVASMGILVAVIATPGEAAQDVADAVVGAGVPSILNFTADSLHVPEGVVVRRVDLATELQILSFYQQRSTAADRGFQYFTDVDGPVPD